MRIQKLVKRAAAITVSAALLAGVTACGGTEPVSNNSNDQEQAESADEGSDAVDQADAVADEGSDAEIAFDAEENTIRFAIQAGTIRTAVEILADGLGYYEEEGVNVELVDSNDATATLTSISSGKDDIDVYGQGIVPDLTFIANGSDLVIFEGPFLLHHRLRPCT